MNKEVFSQEIEEESTGVDLKHLHVEKIEINLKIKEECYVI